MNHRKMSDRVKNAAEAFRRSLPEFEREPGVEQLCWPTEKGFVWIRATPGREGHLSGQEEDNPKLYRFDFQRAKTDSPDGPPSDEQFKGVLKAWDEEHSRVAPRRTAPESRTATPPSPGAGATEGGKSNPGPSRG